MKHSLAAIIALAFAVAWLPGCVVSPTEVPAGDQATLTRTPLGEEESKTPESAEGTPEATLPYEARRAVEMAKEDLARRLEISVSDIAVISVEAVDWPDTSLGCPEPGMAYAQVITPGSLIMLDTKGQTYEYHSDRDSSVVLCQGDA
jgi:hypothetical protein